MTHRNGESRVILKLFLIIGVLGLTMSFFREDKKDHFEGRYSRMGDPIVPAKGVPSSNFPLFPWSEETNTRDKDTDRNKDKDTNETQDENKEKGKDKDPEKEYPFDHTEGIIGRIDQAPDDAYDNLFHVQLPFLSAEIEGRLEYEVQGSPGTEIYLSLNHEASQKETLTRKGWQKKTRYLTPSELRTPDNVLLFSAPEGTTYRIKNPKIYLSSGASP
ncbi:MAG: hypothetical protein LBP34_04445, partial [Flavobacteriaceae bacterium]|nr:hypothetical protein [Flavobacteriaceae bacterium]